MAVLITQLSGTPSTRGRNAAPLQRHVAGARYVSLAPTGKLGRRISGTACNLQNEPSGSYAAVVARRLHRKCKLRVLAVASSPWLESIADLGSAPARFLVNSGIQLMKRRSSREDRGSLA